MRGATLTGFGRLAVGDGKRLPSRLGLALALVACALLTAPTAEARITHIVIDPTRPQSPTFGGRAFGAAGQYEKLRGTAFGELDPSDPHNAVITDIELAPRNRDGMVEYSTDIFILKPINLKNGNHRLFIDYNSRGQMRLGRLNDVELNNNPTTAADAGSGFVMNLGYSIVSMGRDFGATGFDSMKISVPVATNPGGSPITGRSYEYIVFDNATTTRAPLTYPAATLDKSQATLTVRARLDDANDLVHLGFNEDEDGHRVSDGILSWTAGGSGDQINYRFAQTGRTERNRQNHLYPEGVFPFAHQVLTDHLSGKTAGRDERCLASGTCPKRFEANSSNEYWVKAGSLLHTDTRGNDLKDPENARFYLLSGLSHGVGDITDRGQSVVR
jgi:hypothetical protein